MYPYRILVKGVLGGRGVPILHFASERFQSSDSFQPLWSQGSCSPPEVDRIWIIYGYWSKFPIIRGPIFGFPL